MTDDEDLPIVVLPGAETIPDQTAGFPASEALAVRRPRGRPRKDGKPIQQRSRIPKPTAGEMDDPDVPSGRKSVSKARETKGMGLKDLSEYAIFPAFILNQMKEMNYVSRKVSALKLFGATANLNQSPDDELLVRILREQGKMYRNALDREDTKGAQAALDSLMKMQLGVMARSESLLGMAIKIQSDAAKLQEKKRVDEMAFTEAELVAQSGVE